MDTVEPNVGSLKQRVEYAVTDTEIGNSAATVGLNQPARTLSIRWPDGEVNQYHYVWLRHSARCFGGMPNDTSIKIDLLPDDPTTLVVANCVIEENRLRIDWADAGLVTFHELEDLRRSAYDQPARERRKHRPSLWDAQSASAISVFNFSALENESKQLDLLLAVRDFGVAKITGLPHRLGSVRDVARLFGPIHVNNYGEVFDVKSDASRSLGSNTGVDLPPHTDESYRHDAPGISFFHCINATAEGGESILVDGFRAAETLQTRHPDSFKVLTSVPIFFQRYALPDEDMRSHTRILVQDIDGDIVGVRWTDRTLAPQDLPPAWVEPVYKALRALWQIINDADLKHRYLMKPGDLHIFDNHRVLHGRTAFDTAAGARHLQQCSVNRDEFHSTLRTLAARLGSPASELIMAGGAVG